MPCPSNVRSSIAEPVPFVYIILVLMPLGGISSDVVTDIDPVVAVSDYMFVVVSMPEFCARCVAFLVYAFGDGGFV